MAIGNMSGFRLPSMMEDINIEEIVSRSKRAPAKPKPKTKAKTKAKAKPVVKAKAKPKPLTKPRGRPGIRVGEDLANRPKKITHKSTPRPKPRPKPVVVSKPKPKPRPKVRPSMMGGEDLAVRPTSRPTSRPTKVVSKPQFKPKVTPRPSSVKVPTRPKISGEDLMRVSSQTKGRPNIPNIGMSSVMPGVNINIEEIIKQATPTPAPAQQPETSPQESIISKIAAQAKPETSGVEEQTSSMSDEEMLAILQKLFGGQSPQEPMVLEKPQLPQVQQWNMMGPQQPINPIVAAGPQQPSQFMPRPQIPSEMFGGYGGTAPIVPAMAYAGLGGLPQMPIMPAPQYDPDAEPGGPPMPTGPVFT